MLPKRIGVVPPKQRASPKQHRIDYVSTLEEGYANVFSDFRTPSK
jgi:hypothetical protein